MAARNTDPMVASPHNYARLILSSHDYDKLSILLYSLNHARYRSPIDINRERSPMHESLSGPNAVAADRMTAEERLAEVGRLLAAGILRLRTRDIRLDFPPDKSGVGREPRTSVRG